MLQPSYWYRLRYCQSYWRIHWDRLSIGSSLWALSICCRRVFAVRYFWVLWLIYVVGQVLDLFVQVDDALQGFLLEQAVRCNMGLFLQETLQGFGRGVLHGYIKKQQFEIELFKGQPLLTRSISSMRYSALHYFSKLGNFGFFKDSTIQNFRIPR